MAAALDVLTRQVHLPHNRLGEDMPAEDLALLQGTLDLLVLKTISWEPAHGYAVTRAIRERTGDELQIEEAALYAALHRMEKRGWLDSEWGASENNRKAKYYRLTAAGRRQLRAQTATWTRYARAVFSVLDVRFET
jgi:PadR family transcriptional regulator PadR